MATLSASNASDLQTAIDLMVKQNAVEIPFDAGIIERVARVSESVGFQSSGTFKENAKLRPISILLELAKFLGT